MTGGRTEVLQTGYHSSNKRDSCLVFDHYSFLVRPVLNRIKMNFADLFNKGRFFITDGLSE